VFNPSRGAIEVAGLVVASHKGSIGLGRPVMVLMTTSLVTNVTWQNNRNHDGLIVLIVKFG
jgi:hypothetical protein